MLSLAMTVDFQEINRKIRECRKIEDIDRRIACLKKLFDETEDGMVAYALGEELENVGMLEEALKYYEEAKARFPLPKYQNMAKASIDRVHEKLRAQTAQRMDLKEGQTLILEELDLGNFDPASTLIIVACTKMKIWDVDENAPKYVPARVAYVGNSFKKFVEWLDKNSWKEKGYQWVILSAKYGYIEPWHPISNYNVTFNDESTGPVSDETLYRQVMFQDILPNKKLKDFKTLICIGSYVYIEKIKKSFRDVTCKIISVKSEDELSEMSSKHEKSLSRFFKSLIRK